jgi:hypothetical protein
MNARQRRKARRQIALYSKKLPPRILDDSKFFIARCVVGAYSLRNREDRKEQFVELLKERLESYAAAAKKPPRP